MIVNDRVPNGAATARFPPVMLFGFLAPGVVGKFLHHLVARGVVGFALGVWHGVETPDLLAGIYIVGSHKAARAEFGAAIADDYFILHDAREAGDRTVRLGIESLY